MFYAGNCARTGGGGWWYHSEFEPERQIQRMPQRGLHVQIVLELRVHRRYEDENKEEELNVCTSDLFSLFTIFPFLLVFYCLFLLKKSNV